MGKIVSKELSLQWKQCITGKTNAVTFLKFGQSIYHISDIIPVGKSVLSHKKFYCLSIFSMKTNPNLFSLFSQTLLNTDPESRQVLLHRKQAYSFKIHLTPPRSTVLLTHNYFLFLTLTATILFLHSSQTAATTKSRLQLKTEIVSFYDKFLEVGSISLSLCGFLNLGKTKIRVVQFWF